MKKVTIFILIFALTLSICCTKHKESPNKNDTGHSPIELVRKEATHFSQIGHIKKALNLEVTDDSFINYINYIMIDKTTGDILVGDFNRINKVYRFTKDGRFITSYGKHGQGPGEIIYLEDFTLCPNGDIILLAYDKILKYTRDGVLLLEKRISFNANDIEIIDDLLYISIRRFMSSPNGKNAIFVLDKDFKLVNQIGEYDTRLEKYSFTFRSSLAKKTKDLFFLDFYDLNLNIYNTDTKATNQISFPNDNNRLATTWNKKRLIETDQNKIMDQLHRFGGIHSFKENLLLIESCREKNVSNLWLYDLTKKKAFIFPYKTIYGYHNPKSQPDLYFAGIAGSYENGVICIIRSIEEFNAHKDKYPILKDLTLTLEDNPILVFFEFDMDNIEKLKNE